MRSSTKALLWVLLVFLIGAVFGAAVVRLSQRARLGADGRSARGVEMRSPEVPSSPRPSGQNPGQGRPWQVSQNVLQRMLSGLEMDEAQTAEARLILERARSDYHRIEQRRMQQQRMIRQRALRELREILTPRQRRQLRQFLNQLRER